MQKSEDAHPLDVDASVPRPEQDSRTHRRRQALRAHAGRTAVDALEATLAERLQLSDGTPWMNTAEVADYSRAELD